MGFLRRGRKAAAVAAVAAVLLLGTVARAAEQYEVTEAFTQDAYDYDGDALVFTNFATLNVDAVAANVTAGKVTGDGLSVIGYETQTTPTARLILTMTALTVDDASVAFTNLMPTNAVIRVVGTTATMTGDRTLFNLEGLKLQNNVSLTLEATTATWENSATGGHVVSYVGGSGSGGLGVSTTSALYVVGVEATGAASLLYTSPDYMSALVVEDRSVIAVDVSTCTGCYGPVVSLGQPLVVRDSSMFRVGNITVSDSLPADSDRVGLLSCPGGTQVSGSSLYQVSDCTLLDSTSLFDFGTAADGGSFEVSDNSVVTFARLTAGSTGLTAETPRPDVVDETSHVYGVAKIGGTDLDTVAKLKDNGLNVDTALNWDGTVVGGSSCSYATCIPGAMGSIPAEADSKCVCPCKTEFNSPACTSSSDPTNNYGGINSGDLLCYVPNCEKCDSRNPDVCLECKPGYYLINSATVCSDTPPATTSSTVAPTTTTRAPTTTTTAAPCKVANCAQCDNKDGKICVTCAAGYTLSGNRKTCVANLDGTAAPAASLLLAAVAAAVLTL